MGYERQRNDRYKNNRDYRQDRQDSEPKTRKRSKSRSQSNEYRRKERYNNHHYERDFDHPPRRDARDDRNYRGHSRSRSKDRKNDEQLRNEEKEQNIRLAIRNNTITYDLAIHEMFTKLPEAKKKEIMEQAQSPEKIHECILVRELYVSGLFDVSDAAIRTFFSKYGQIQEVQIIKNFVFVKYYKIEDASNACADYHSINTTLHQTHNNNFKIFFADHLKRFNVVSNNPLYEVKEHLIPVVYASVRNQPQFINEHYLSSLFSRFGFIRNIEVKHNELPTQRTYVLVEYETLGQALRAREKMKLQRQKLGDRKSEITILIDNDKITRLFPNISNQLRYQRKRQNNNNPSAAQQQQQPAPQTHNNPPPLETYNYQTYAHQEPHKEVDQMIDILKQFAQNPDQQDENGSSDWCGFLTRNKQRKVEVDFFSIHGEPFELESILNVAYRADLQQSLNRNDLIFAGKFKAANSSHVESFQEYIEYFTNRQRAGIIFTSKYLIYLIPPLTYLNISYHVERNQLLSLFFQLP